MKKRIAEATKTGEAATTSKDKPKTGSAAASSATPGKKGAAATSKDTAKTDSAKPATGAASKKTTAAAPDGKKAAKEASEKATKEAAAKAAKEAAAKDTAKTATTAEPTSGQTGGTASTASPTSSPTGGATPTASPTSGQSGPAASSPDKNPYPDFDKIPRPGIDMEVSEWMKKYGHIYAPPIGYDFGSKDKSEGAGGTGASSGQGGPPGSPRRPTYSVPPFLRSQPPVDHRGLVGADHPLEPWYYAPRVRERLNEELNDLYREEFLKYWGLGMLGMATKLITAKEAALALAVATANKVGQDAALDAAGLFALFLQQAHAGDVQTGLGGVTTLPRPLPGASSGGGGSPGSPPGHDSRPGGARQGPPTGGEGEEAWAFYRGVRSGVEQSLAAERADLERNRRSYADARAENAPAYFELIQKNEAKIANLQALLDALR